MVKTRTSIKDIAREAIQLLNKSVPVEAAFLFGSYARKTARKDSDIDLAVISRDLAKMGTFDRIRLLSSLPVSVDSRLEVLAFSPLEFKKAGRGTLIGLIKREGIQLV